LNKAWDLVRGKHYAKALARCLLLGCMHVTLATGLLMYFLLPLWLAAGLADWYCHRRSDIAHTAGLKESLIHLLMFAEVGLPLLAALFLEVNAALLLFMVIMFFVHEATALWDVRYAVSQREVTPWEQHVHSFLEMIPLMAILLLVVLHDDQAQALAKATLTREALALRLKEPPLPAGYVAGLLAAIVLFSALPYLEELWRCFKARGPAARAARR
jgi:hypothetical protein